MANQPKHHDRAQKPKLNKDILLAVAFAVFVVLALAAMMTIDAIGEARLGDMNSATMHQDAAANHAG